MVMMDKFIEQAKEKLKSESEDVRFNTLKDLIKAKDTETFPLLVDSLSDQSYRIREEASKGICMLEPDILFPKLEDFLRNDERADLRNAAITIFPRYGTKSLEKLGKLVKDSNEEVRLFTTQILGDIPESPSIDILIEALKDQDINVRHAAAESLGKIGDPKAVKPLTQTLNDEFWVQYSAVNALGDIGDPSCVGALVEKLDDEMLRQPVVQALGKIGEMSVVPVLISMLTLKEATIRNDVIAALVKIHTKSSSQNINDQDYLPKIQKSLANEEITDHLLTSLKDSDLEVKRNAIIALGWLREKKAISSLLAFLNNYELEEYVTGSIVSIGENAVDELVKALPEADPGLQVSIIRCLGWIDDEKGILACIPYLQNKNREVVRQSLVTMTGSLESKEVESALLKMIPSKDEEVNDELIEILGKSRSKSLVKQISDLLKEDNHELKKTGLKILGKTKDKSSIDTVTKLLADKNDEIRADAFKAFCYISPTDINAETITKGLTEKSPTVRKALASALSTKGVANAEESLLLLLKDNDPEVRTMSIKALSEIGTNKCVNDLIAIFTKNDKTIKAEIIQTIGKICNRHEEKTCLKFLTDILKDTDNDLKRIAIRLLGESQDSKVIPDLLLVLDAPDWSVRSETIRAIGKIGEQKTIKHLIKRLEDSEDIIKKDAIWALSQLKAKEAVKKILPLIHNENLQLEVLEALQNIDVSEDNDFYDFLKRSNTKIKCLLIDLLGRLKSSSSLEHLLEILNDDFFVVRRHAAKALGDLGDKTAIPHLFKAQKDDPSDEVRKEATSSLKKFDKN